MNMTTRYLRQFLNKSCYNFCHLIASKSCPVVSLNVAYASLVTLPEFKDATVEQQEVKKWLKEAEECGFKIPTVMSERNFKILSEIDSERRKKKYLYHLYFRELKKEANKAKIKEKQELKKVTAQSLKHQIDDTNVKYGIWNNTNYIKFNPKHQKTYLNLKVLQNYMLAPNVVIDCDFDTVMSHQEAQSLAKQIMFACSSNRNCEFPSNLHLCNVDQNSKYYDHLQHMLPHLDSFKLPLYLHNKSYVDIFPKNKIIYLTPNAECDMEIFDMDAVYVIGGVVDLLIKPITVKKAEQEKVRTQKLPLDRYLKIQGRKALNIDTVVDILNTLQISNDWNEALRHVPSKFIRKTE